VTLRIAERRRNVGFSLKTFFTALEGMLEGMEDDDITLMQITELVADQKKYAEECGVLD